MRQRRGGHLIRVVGAIVLLWLASGLARADTINRFYITGAMIESHLTAGTFAETPGLCDVGSPGNYLASCGVFAAAVQSTEGGVLDPTGLQPPIRSGQNAWEAFIDTGLYMTGDYAFFIDRYTLSSYHDVSLLTHDPDTIGGSYELQSGPQTGVAPMSFDAWFVFGLTNPPLVTRPVGIQVVLLYAVFDASGNQLPQAGKTYASAPIFMDGDPVPEPATGGLLIVALMAAGALRRLRAQR